MGLPWNKGKIAEIQDGGNVISVDDGGGSLTVDGTISEVTQSNIYGWNNRDGNWERVGVDEGTNGFFILEYEHHEIHAGEHYFAYHSASLGNTEQLTISIQTPDTTKWAHIVWTWNTTQPATLDILEDITSITGGAAFTPINNNRNSNNSSGMTVKVASDEGGDTAISPSGGSEIFSRFFGASGLFGTDTAVADSRKDNELMLKQNSLYLFRITAGAASCDVNLHMSWYEHTTL